MKHKNTKQIKNRLIIFILLLLLPSFSQEKKDNENPEMKNWEILYHQTDSLDIAKKETDWNQINVPEMFSLPYDPIGDFQFVWLRGTFEINSTPDKFYGITIENPYHSIVLYINNKKVGERTAQECFSIHNPMDIQIPNGILKQEKNEIYIYLGIYDNYPGGLSKNIIIHKRKSFIRTKNFNRFIYYEVPFGSAFFLLILIIFNISMFIWDRKEKANLYSALLCLISLIQLVLLFIPFINVDIIFRLNIFYFIMWYVPIVYIYLIQSLYDEFLYGINKFFTIPIMIFSIHPFINIFTNFNIPFTGIFVIAMTLASLIFNIYIIYRLNAIKPDTLLFYFFIICCLTIPYILWTIDIINYFFINHTPPLNFVLLSPVFMIILMVLVIRKISHKHHKMETLYKQLQESLNQPSKKKKTKVQITRINQKKLDSIITFINENYRDDISREGMASSVDLSPDHLSRLFNLYTGKRINNFINEFRVKDAAQRLIETDSKIIDIAFSVGFESVTTFNRVFLEINGKTPSSFRNENL